MGCKLACVAVMSSYTRLTAADDGTQERDSLVTRLCVATFQLVSSTVTQEVVARVLTASLRL